jgi:hypothetical protein
MELAMEAVQGKLRLLREQRSLSSPQGYPCMPTSTDVPATDA